LAEASDVPFILFTDDPSLRSDAWEVRVVRPAFPLDPVRSARAVKLLGDASLAEFSETLWVDNRVELLAGPDRVCAEWLAGADFAVGRHSFRERLVDEFDAVVASGFDDPTRVYEQLIHYAETAPDVLDGPVFWTGIVARRHTAPVAAAMRTWFDHVLRYSRRDQLSLPYVLHDAAPHLAWTVLDFDNLASAWHRWPRIDAHLGRRQDDPRIRFDQAIRAPLAKLRQAEARLEQMEATLAEARELEYRAEAEAARVSAELSIAASERDTARAALATRSTEWDRLTEAVGAAEAHSKHLAKELNAATTRRERAEAAVSDTQALLAQAREAKRDAAERARTKLIATRQAEAAAKAELARIRRSRAYRLARAAGALRGN
jgi:hypothetical protein